MDWITIIKDLGLLGLVGLILKWVFTEQARINSQIDSERKDWMKQTDERAKRWQEIVSSFNACQSQLMAEHRDFRESVSEAHRFQREEHKELMTQMKEVTLTLGRINGYKDEHE